MTEYLENGKITHQDPDDPDLKTINLLDMNEVVEGHFNPKLQLQILGIFNHAVLNHSWLKNLGLKLRVEKSGSEMSFNQQKMKGLALDLIDLDTNLTNGNEWWGKPKERYEYLMHLLYNGM